MATNKMIINRGNTLIMNYVNQDTSGNPISLVGATIYFTVKATPGWDTVADDTSAIWKLSSTGNSGNSCTFTSTPTETWVAPATYFWDITIIYSDGSVITPLVGNLVINPISTNRAS